MKRVWKWQAVVLLAIVTLMSFGIGAQAASNNFKTFEYQFSEGDGDKFNDVAYLKKMEITFDNPISELKLLKDNIYVREVGETDRLNIIATRVINGNTLSISFKNIDFIDYTQIINLELVIEEETLQFDQINKYVLPFTISDILPGFKSLFIDTKPEDINNKIFKHNPPRDIYIHVPYMFIEQIETIHRNDGIGSEKGPHLTNIDVLANPSVARLKTSFNDNTDEQYRRDLDPHSGLKGHGFTMGQAGIDAALESEKDTAKSFELKAYSAHGRLLETRKFPLLVIDRENNFKYNGYLKKPDKVFGETKTLYELMSDTKLLNTIMQGIPVSDFESALGISFTNMNNPVAMVTNEEQLTMALENPKLKTIDLGNNSITVDLTITRDVTIKNGTIAGNVVLGDGSEDLLIRLDQVNINGDLTIDVGGEGTAVVSTSQVTGNTIIVSGAEKSIHLHDFNSIPNGITFANTTPVRVVMSHSIDTAASKDFKLTMVSSQKVTLEGIAGKATVNVADGITANLEVKNGTGNVTGPDLEDGKVLNLHISEEINLPTPTPAGWNVEILDSIIEDGKKVVEKNYPGKPLSKSAFDWDKGFELDNLNDLRLPTNLAMTVENPKVFGPDSNVSFENKILKITGNFALTTADIIIKGESDGKIYKVRVTVTIE